VPDTYYDRLMAALDKDDLPVAVTVEEGRVRTVVYTVKSWSPLREAVDDQMTADAVKLLVQTAIATRNGADG
jgi:hypothetical protein